jgi:molybdopterin converting factor small subunit
MTDTLGDALPREMTRVRTVVLPAYREILETCPPAAITIELINASIDRAQTALAEGDVVAMIRAYEDLKGWTE